MKNIKSFTAISYPLLLLAAILFLFSSCEEHKHENEQEHAEEEQHHEEGATEVEINTVQYRQLDIQLSETEQRSMTATLKTTGYLKVPPQNKASITSLLGGTVNSILIKEGDYVQRGQTLITLASQEFLKMQQDYVEAQSQLTFAEAEYNRQKELREKNVSAQKTFQQAESNYKSLKAKTESLKSQLKLLRVDIIQVSNFNFQNTIAIKSPVNGNISHIDVNIGATVDPTTIMMDVVDNSQLHLDMFVFEQDLTKIQVGQLVELWLTNLPGKHYHAKIFAIGSAFEGESKSIPVHATITGDKTGLIEGMNVSAMISTQNNLATVVPATAVTSFGGSEFIFISRSHAEKDSAQVFHFNRLPVKKGITIDGYTEIFPLQNLEEHAQVVTNGSYYLNAMLTNESGEHEH